jgi:hypothetical protein
MKVRREEKAELRDIEQRMGIGRRLRQMDTQCFEDIRTAGLRRYRAIAVLDDRYAGCRSHQGRTRRQIQTARGVTAGTDHICGRRGSAEVEAAGKSTHRGCQAAQLGGGLTLDPQRHQQGSSYSRRQLLIGERGMSLPPGFARV